MVGRSVVARKKPCAFFLHSSQELLHSVSDNFRLPLVLRGVDFAYEFFFCGVFPPPHPPRNGLIFLCVNVFVRVCVRIWSGSNEIFRATKIVLLIFIYRHIFLLLLIPREIQGHAPITRRGNTPMGVRNEERRTNTNFLTT